jgi:hypothetical protein
MILKKALLWASLDPWHVTSLVKSDSLACWLTWLGRYYDSKQDQKAEAICHFLCIVNRKQFLCSIIYLVNSVFLNRTAHFILKQ